MKNYYIDRFLTVYNNGVFIDTQKVDRVQVMDAASGAQYIRSKTPQAITSKHGWSIYESYVMTVKTESNYKRFIKAITPDGIICNV